MTVIQSTLEGRQQPTAADMRVPAAAPAMRGPVVQRASEATQTRGVMSYEGAGSCPFSSLGMGKVDIERYLSDAQERLHGESWKLYTSEQVNSLVLKHREQPDFLAAYDALEARMQEAMKTRIVGFRNRIHRFAITLVECIRFADQGNQQLAADCFEELQNLDSEIKEVYSTNKQALCSVLEEFHQSLQSHVVSGTNAESQQALSSAMLVGLWPASALGISLPVAGWVRPNLLSTVDLTNSWHKPEVWLPNGTVRYSSEGTVKLTAKGTGKLLGFGLLGCVILQCLRVFASRKAREAAQHEKLAKLSALRLKFVRQNESMWDGMVMWVEDVQQSIKELKKLQPERVMMRQAQLRDIATKLFGMSMAVDEYIFWLNKHRYFPANFSIRNWITPDRYDQIKSIVDKPAQPISDGS